MTGVVVAGAVALIALCTAGAFALRSVGRIWLRHLLERQPAGAAIAEQYLARPQRLHAAAGGATALAAFAAGAAAGDAGSVLATVLWAVAAFTAICVLGVAVPRGIARRFPTRVIPVTLPVLRAADVVLAPTRVLAERTAGARGVAQRAADLAEPDSRNDLEDLLREGQLEGVGDETELAIISGVVQFGEKSAGDVLTPRAELFALDVATPTPDLVRAVAASGYSRVPVYRGTVDEIVGLVLAFDVLLTGGERPPSVHPVLTVAPDHACTELLGRMLRAGIHLAVVRDAAGVTLGIVTLEDLLEQLVGDIRDEHDEPGPPDATAAPTAARAPSSAG